MVFLVTLALLISSSLSSQQLLSSRSTYKGLNGIVPISQVSINGLKRIVYYHDQAVGVVDVNEKNEIQNCDIVEVYEPSELVEVLANLSTISHPTEVSFAQMTSLMYQCQTLDRLKQMTSGAGSEKSLKRAYKFGVNAFNLLSGITPGTKWCGTGDIAETYHDLGPDVELDRCCRTHDLCPVKIRSHRSRYNLTNISIYSKSHCDCDNAFYNCLKSIGSSTATIIGKIFFNILRVGCIEDLPNSVQMSTGLSRRFSATKLYY